MVDQVDRAQELEQIQRDEVPHRVLDRPRPAPAATQPSQSPDQTERADS